MSEAEQILRGLQRQSVMPAMDVVAAIDADPEGAARAIKLSQATGVPAPVVHGDLENFERESKASLAGDIVRNNPIIAEYVRSNPLAATLSNDDYGHLDKASGYGAYLSRARSILAAPYEMFAAADAGIAKGFSEGFGQGGLGSWITPDDWVKYPLFASTMSVIAAPLEGILRAGSGVIKGVEEGARAATEVGYTSFGGDPADARRLGRDIAGIVQMQTTPGAAVHGPGKPPPVAQAVETVIRIKPWLEQGLEPPRGIDPLVDQIKAERNRQELEKLDEWVAEAQISTTRERDPEFYANFARQAIGERKIGISGDAIVALYGDKIPDPADGILGWVPDIQAQLDLARETGADISIPIADWVAKVDPALAKQLHDDIRVRPGNITTREAAIPELKLPLDSPLAQVRAAAGFEPLLSVGDKRLTLARLEKEVKELTTDEQVLLDGMAEEGRLNHPELVEELVKRDRKRLDDMTDEELAAYQDRADDLIARRNAATNPVGPEQGFHDFKMVDELGRDVGIINLSEQRGGKDLYVDYVQGVGGHGPRAFGPTLMRSLLQQLKAAFPNAERIGGFRVSGARDAVGKIGETYVKLDVPEGWDTIENANELRRILEGGQWEDWSPTSRAYIIPDPARSAVDKEIIKAVNEEMARIVPREVSVKPAERIEAIGAQGVEGLVEPNAIYIRRKDTYPIILYAMEGPDPIGSARHEAIHHLRHYGFFKPEEWAILERASKENGWAEQFGIDRRYATASEAVRLEESIADAFKAWAAGRLEAMPEVAGVFAKMKEFFDRIIKRIEEILGKDNPTWEDIFARVQEGEVGTREGNKPLNPEHFQRLDVPEEEVKRERQDIINAGASGLPVDTFKRLQRLIEKRNEEDVAAATKRIEREERKRQTKEWKAAADEIRPEVVEEIKARPDVAVDLFLTRGEAFGERIPGTFRIRTDDFTAEQQAALPRHYLAKNGLAADDVAHMFGFTDKNHLAEKLAEYNAAKGNKNAEVFRRQLIDAEVNRRLEARFGSLEDNIIDAAKDHVLGQTQIDLLAEEMHAVGLRAGVAPITKEKAKAWVDETFAKQKIGDISSDKFLLRAGQLGKNAEAELIKGNPNEAFHWMQKRYLTTLLAAETRKIEKARQALDRTARVYLRPDPPKAVEGIFADHISRLLSQAGYRVRRRPEDLERSLEFHGQADLNAFTAKLRSDGWEPAVADWLGYELRQRASKGVESLSVEDFREFKDAIDSLNHIGRQVRKIELAGEQAEFAEFKRQVLEKITSLPERSRQDQQGKRLYDKAWRWLFNIDASLTRMEEIVKDLDVREELGPLWDAVIRPMEMAKTKEFDLMSELAEHFRKTKGDFGKTWRKSLGETLPNDVIMDPHTGAFYDMTRENLIQIMLNWGNRSNIEKYVAGAGYARFGRKLNKEELPIFEQYIKNYIDTHARKEDWEFVQRMWEPFKKWQGEMDVVARNTSGVAPKWIEPTMVETPHGTFEGGYWPVKYDRLASGIDAVRDRDYHGTDGIFGTDYFRAATAKGYLKERTGYVDFVDISTSIEQAAATMQQTIHDIAFRDALMQASKVFYDKDIRNAIKKHYGMEYDKQLIPWLKRISYQFATDEASMKGWNDFLRRARVNLVGHSLPLNLKVILSPDVGVPNPKAWAAFASDKKYYTELAMERSSEIRHMVYNMDRDYNDALNRLTVEFGADSARRKAVEWGYKPMMYVSQQFRIATFVDQYHKALERGKTETEAAYIADSYVRERHGAASIVDLPAALSSTEGMKMLTIFQGYFNTMYNWQRQIPGNIRRGEWSNAMVNTYGAIGVGAAFGAALFNKQREDDSWFKTIAKALLIQPLSTVPILSHATQMYAEGFAPRLPFASMLSAVGSAVSDIGKVMQGKKVEKPVQHTANVIGLAAGIPLAQIGRTGEFLYDAVIGEQRPRNIGEWLRGIISGEARLKK